MVKNFFSSDLKAFMFVFEEVILIFLIIFQLFYMLGIKFFSNKVLFLQNELMFQNYLWLFASTFFLITIYFGVALRDKKVLAVHKQFLKIIFSSTKQKMFGLDRELISLLIFEFIFAIIIAMAIFIYLDPEINLVPWPINYISFFIIFIFGFYIFSKTKLFRAAVYEDSFLKKKILPAERLFNVNRFTNKSGSIRIKAKTKYNKKNLIKRKKR